MRRRTKVNASSSNCRFVFQNQQLRAFQFRQGRRFSVGIQKFNLEDAGRKYFHDRPDLSGNQAFGRLVFEQGYDIQ